MSNEESIAIIKGHVDLLAQLLSDPHPGFFAWIEAYGREIKWLTTYWNSGIESADRQMNTAPSAVSAPSTQPTGALGSETPPGPAPSAESQATEAAPQQERCYSTKDLP